MSVTRKRYDPNHWIRSDDPEEAFVAYMEQQKKAYSQVKNAFVAELLGDLRGKRFLDYGCGGGLFTVYAAKEGASTIVGVDAEDTVLSTARYFARKEEVERLCRFVHSESFPALGANGRFDVILMKDVIEHAPDDDALFEAAAQAIAPGGNIVISTQNALSLNYLVQGTYHRVLRGEKSWYGWDPTHIRFYTPGLLKTKLTSAGFDIVAWRSVYIVPYKLPAIPGFGRRFLRIDAMSRLDQILGRIFPYNRLGWNIIVKAEAPPLASLKVPVITSLKRQLQPL